MTIREQVLDIVEGNRERTFLVDAVSGRQLSYGEFHQRACALAVEFRRRGLVHGDRVGVMLPNSCELAVLYFACLYMGATIVPVNPNLSVGDLRFIVSTCRPRLVVTSPSLRERAIGAIPADSHTVCLTLATAPEAALWLRSTSRRWVSLRTSRHWRHPRSTICLCLYTPRELPRSRKDWRTRPAVWFAMLAPLLRSRKLAVPVVFI